MGPSLRPLRLAFALLAMLAADRAQAQVFNGSFETGDFSNWVTQDLNNPLIALQVGPAGIDNLFTAFTTDPTDGTLCAVTGFDGDGPGTIFLAQDVNIPTDRTTLLFDYGGGWDLVDFASATLDRTFSVVIEPSGGGSPLASTLLQTAVHGTVVDDTGLITAELDLSAFAGETVRVKFQWIVPEDFSGPGICEVDNVRLVGKKLPATDAATVKVKLDLTQAGADTLNLDLVVPAAQGFDPTGKSVNVTVGDVSRDFVLDDKGAATVGSDTVKVLAVSGNAAARKISLRCKDGDFLAGLSPFGLADVNTGTAGLSAALPVTVTLDGNLTSRTLQVLYKATAGVKGSASAKVAAEKRPVKLTVKLNFAAPSLDSATLKASGVVLPGFVPNGQTAAATVGSLSRVFTLDEKGKGAAGDSTISIKRDKKNPSLFTISFKCKQADLVSTFDDDGLVNANVPKPGDDVPLTLDLALGGRSVQIFLHAAWVATQGKSGTATGTF